MPLCGENMTDNLWSNTIESHVVWMCVALRIRIWYEMLNVRMNDWLMCAERCADVTRYMPPTNNSYSSECNKKESRTRFYFMVWHSQMLKMFNDDWGCVCLDFETWQKKLKLNMRNLTWIYLNRMLCLSRCSGFFLWLCFYYCLLFGFAGV